ncbi:MAG TPA: zinc ribbon domain-containing protein [Actinobacteria bacterium]|nr:zinc ribbon domain-containing protein [Actinomycetota bacterium]
MPIYQLRCPGGHSFEVIQSLHAPLPACPHCGGETAKVPSTFGFAGQAARSLPPPPEAMPQTWRGTYEGNREYVTHLRRIAERRKVLEERHPELTGDQRPILAHEGRFEAVPLRAGDLIAPAAAPGRPGEPTPPGPAGGSAAHGHTHAE